MSKGRSEMVNNLVTYDGELKTTNWIQCKIVYNTEDASPSYANQPHLVLSKKGNSAHVGENHTLHLLCLNSSRASGIHFWSCQKKKNQNITSRLAWRSECGGCVDAYLSIPKEELSGNVIATIFRHAITKYGYLSAAKTKAQLLGCNKPLP